MLKIRLRRMGKRHSPFYRVVVSDSRRTPTASAVDEVGHYDPQPSPPRLALNLDRLRYWQQQGAQLSPTVQKLIKRAESGTLEGGAQAPAAEEAKPARAKKAAEPAAAEAPQATAEKAPQAAAAEQAEPAAEEAKPATEQPAAEQAEPAKQAKTAAEAPAAEEAKPAAEAPQAAAEEAKPAAEQAAAEKPAAEEAAPEGADETAGKPTGG